MRPFHRGILLVVVLVTGTVLGTTGLAGAVSVQEHRPAGEDDRPASQTGSDGASSIDGQANQTAGAVDSDNDAEPSDDRTTAIEMSPGENVSGRIDTGDIDVVDVSAASPSDTDNESASMTARSDGSYYITTTSRNDSPADYDIRTESAGEIEQGNVTGTVTNGSDEPIAGATVRVTDSDGGVAAVASTDSDGEYRVDVPGGEYTVIADAWYGRSNVSITVDTATTTEQHLVVRPGPDANDAYEPNDDYDTAASITNGSYPGLKLVDDESDNYAISLEEGDSITASVDFGERDVDGYLTLYGPDGQPITRTRSPSGNSVSDPSVPEDGTYYFEVFGVTDSPVPYSLDVAVDDPPAVREFDTIDDGPGGVRQIVVGGETTVTMDVTAASDSVTINETISPAVANVSVDSVTVAGDAVAPVVATGDSDGVYVVVDDVTAGQTVTVRYTISTGETAPGATHTVTGTVTSDGNTSVGAETIRIRGGLPRVALPYDADGDNNISAEELGTAGEDFARGELTAAELGTIGRVFASN